MMILNFRHKGLRAFYVSGNASKIQSHHTKRLRLILGVLAVSAKPEDMNLPGLDFHQLKTTTPRRYAVKVNKNWRVTFEHDDLYITNVDYEDYH